MLRQSRLSGFFKQEIPKTVRSNEYVFEQQQSELRDTSRHRQVNSFDRYSAKSNQQEYKLYTHAQLENSLQSMYGVQGQQLINICLDEQIIHAAGGKQFITKYSQSEIYDKLNQSVPGLAKIAKTASEKQQNQAKQRDSEQLRNNTIQSNDRFAQRSKRSGALTTDDLRKIPSYQFCLHPDIKSALYRLEQEVVQAKAKGLVQPKLAAEWEEGIKSVKSEREADDILKKVKAYLGK